MKVLVTGATGRVGAWLTQELVNSDYSVRAMVRPGTRLEANFPLSKIELVEATLSDGESLMAAVSGADIVVHLAAQMPMLNTPVDRYFDINVLGTLRVLEAAVNQSHPVRRFVYASTDNTYGPVHPRMDRIAEEHPQIPGDYYGTSKVLCERLVQNYHKIHGLEYSIVRPGSIIAPEEAAPLFRYDWVRAFFKTHVKAGRRSNLWQLFKQCEDPVEIFDSQIGPREDNPAIVLTDSESKPWSVHFTDVRDVTAGVVLAMEHPAAANEDFNILGPRTTTFAEGAIEIAKTLGTEVVPVAMPMRLTFELSNAKAQDLLGYTPQWSFGETLRSTTTPRVAAPR